MRYRGGGNPFPKHGWLQLLRERRGLPLRAVLLVRVRTCTSACTSDAAAALGVTDTSTAHSAAARSAAAHDAPLPTAALGIADTSTASSAAALA